MARTARGWLRSSYHSGPTRIGILADLYAPSLPIEEAILIGDIPLTPISGPGAPENSPETKAPGLAIPVLR